MEKPLRLGVAGVGVVGTSLIQLLQRRRAEFVARAGRECLLAAYSARHRRERLVDLGGATFFGNAAEMAASADIDVFVELIGGADGIAFEAVKAALARGLPVVTANKAMLAAHGLRLASLSESHKAPLYYEAAVGGGIPIVKTLRESLAGNAIQRVAGILNGTCNYILSRMETDSLPFEVCLAEAQRLGYAEADPTFDVGGFDTAHKLAILASLAFGSKIDADGGLGRGHRIDHARRSRAPPTNSASGSSCSASRNAPSTGSSSASIRRWCRSARRSRRRWASSTRSRSTATRSAN